MIWVYLDENERKEYKKIQLIVEDIDMNLHKYNLIIDTSNSMPLIKNVQLETGDNNEY